MRFNFLFAHNHALCKPGTPPGPRAGALPVRLTNGGVRSAYARATPARAPRPRFAVWLIPPVDPPTSCGKKYNFFP